MVLCKKRKKRKAFYLLPFSSAVGGFFCSLQANKVYFSSSSAAFLSAVLHLGPLSLSHFVIKAHMNTSTPLHLSTQFLSQLLGMLTDNSTYARPAARQLSDKLMGQLEGEKKKLFYQIQIDDIPLKHLNFAKINSNFYITFEVTFLFVTASFILLDIRDLGFSLTGNKHF